ncbi:putative transmembrane protein [Paratrimastix pyriformis]|uniref:Transmembrane protein n=1 Tax=Paratrimastix pyriformis TaxID=342808 RepID=A0ABQ8UTR9_9EUKA|nr:putative transmembrane protein [Paratrimastix pyriformis]
MDTRPSAPHYIETCSRIGITFVFFAWLVVLVASFLIGLLPPIMSSVSMVSAWGCPDGTTSYNPTSCTGVDLATGASLAMTYPSTGELVPENQATRVYASIQNKMGATFGVSRIFTITVSAVGHGAGGLITPSDEEKQYTGTHTRTVTCSVGNSYCNNLLIFVEEAFAKTWDLNVTFARTDAVAGEPDWMGDVRFVWVSTNPGFTSYQLGFRYVLMAISLIALVVFCIVMCRIPGHKHADQKWVIGLLIAVVLLDNPLIALRLLTAGWFWGFVDSIFGATCLAMFMMHLIVLFGGFITNKRSFLQFYLPRLVVVGIFWAVYVATLSILQFRDPTSSYSETPALIPLNIVALVFFLMWALWYLYTLARVLVTCKKDHARQQRKIKGRYLILVIFVNVVVCVFVVGNVIIFFMPISLTQASYLTLYTLVNAYAWVMAIFMAPSKGEVKTSTTWKSVQNPKRNLQQQHPGIPSAGELSELEAEAGHGSGEYGQMGASANVALGEPVVSMPDPAAPAPAPVPTATATTTATSPVAPDEDDGF